MLEFSVNVGMLSDCSDAAFGVTCCAAAGINVRVGSKTACSGTFCVFVVYMFCDASVCADPRSVAGGCNKD